MLQQDKFKYDPTVKESAVENDEDLKLTKHEIVRLTSKNVLTGSNLVIKQDDDDIKLANFQVRESQEELIGLRLHGNSVKKDAFKQSQFASDYPTDFTSGFSSTLHNLNERTTVGTNRETNSSLFRSDANSIHAPVVNLKSDNNPNSFHNNRELLKAKLAAKREQMNQKITAEIANETKMKEGKDEKSVVFPTSFQFKMPPKLAKEPEAEPDYSTIKEEKNQTDFPKETKTETIIESKTENIESVDFQSPQESQGLDDASRSRKKKLIRLSTDEYDKMVAHISILDLSDPLRFVTTPPPTGKIVQLTIIRDRSGIKNKFFPVFHVVFSVD